MHALKEVYSTTILIFEVLGIALFGAIAYGNLPLDEWDDNMNLAPLPSGTQPSAGASAKAHRRTPGLEWLSHLPR
ncbi:MAG: hypothetical protein ACYDC3_12985 [Candidatus Binataceae bacterium]